MARSEGKRKRTDGGAQKRCTRCGKTLPLGDFPSWYDAIRKRTRYESRCRPCRYGEIREFRARKKRERAALGDGDWGALEGLRAEAHAVAEEWRARGLEAVLILRAAATEIHEEISDSGGEYEDVYMEG